MATRSSPTVRAGARMLVLALVGAATIALAGCIQDEVVIPVALLNGKIVPAGIVSSTVTTTTSSVTITINTTVPVVGVRLNTVASGTIVSLIDPKGPQPGSDEHTFCNVDGGYSLPTKQLGHRRVVARGDLFDIGWGDFYPDTFNGEFTSHNLKSVTIPLTSPLRNDPANHLILKEIGRAAFVVFADDFTIDRKPVTAVRLILDDFANAAVGFNVPDDGGADAQTDHAPDTSSWDLSGGDGVFTRVLTGLSSGEHQYGYVINNDGKIRRDPYEEKSDDSSGTRRSVIIVP